MVTVHDAPTARLDPATLYALLRLRAEVFVVEQDCPYLDPDGRDLEPGCVQLWAATDDGTVIATARLLVDPGGERRVGRVCTVPAERGDGVAARLMARAVELAGGAPMVLDAQSHLASWYGRFGFTPTGREFVEDGIPHTEMRRPATAAATR